MKFKEQLGFCGTRGCWCRACIFSLLEYTVQKRNERIARKVISGRSCQKHSEDLLKRVSIERPAKIPVAAVRSAPDAK